MIRSFPKKLGLTISCKKTKSLAVMTQLPKVQRLTTLFQKVSQSKRSPTFSTWAVWCRMTVEWTHISSRICKASSAFQSLSRILWHQCKIQTSTKVKVLNSVIFPNLLYNLESTVLLVSLVCRLESFVVHCLQGFLLGRKSDIPPYAR